MRHVVIANNIVINVVEWDGVSNWTPPAGTTVVLSEVRAGAGWAWNNGNPVDPTPPPPSPPPPTVDFSNSDNIEKGLKAVLGAAALLAGRTSAQAKAAFKTAWDAVS